MLKRRRFVPYLFALIGITLVVDIFIVVFIDKDFFKSPPQPIVEEKQDVFTEKEALEKLQSYKITKQLYSPEISAGKTLKEVYEIKGEVPAFENIGWFYEKTDKDQVYIIGYKQTIAGSLQEPRWEVSKDKIRALNGKAITITPEFGPESW